MLSEEHTQRCRSFSGTGSRVDEPVTPQRVALSVKAVEGRSKPLAIQRRTLRLASSSSVTVHASQSRPPKEA